MKITRVPYWHCCDCGSMSYQFDDVHHIGQCAGIAREQNWDKNNCQICLGLNISTVTYVCASCDKKSDTYQFALEEKSANGKIYFCSWQHVSSFVVGYNISKLYIKE